MSVAVQDKSAAVAEKYIGKQFYNESTALSIANDLVESIPVENLPKIYAMFSANGKLVAVEEVGQTPHQINAQELARTALINASSEILLFSKFQHSGSSNGNKKHPTYAAAMEMPQMRAYAEASHHLKEKDIILRDVVLSDDTHGYMLYSNNVSYVLFPNHDEKPAVCFPDHKKFTPGNIASLSDTLSITCRRSAVSDIPQKNVFITLLDDKDKVMQVCDVEVDNRHLIAPYTKKRKCMFDNVMKYGVKENAASIVMIKHKGFDQDDLHADKDDCEIFHDARNSAKKFGLGMKDCVLVKGEYRHTALSFVDFYGMK